MLAFPSTEEEEEGMSAISRARSFGKTTLYIHSPSVHHVMYHVVRIKGDDDNATHPELFVAFVIFAGRGSAADTS